MVGPPADVPANLPDILASLDLTSTEVRAYQYLLETGGATPSTVARDTGQSRGRIYETLRLLVQKGLAREEPSRPIRYLPVPLAEVIAVTLADVNRRARDLQRAYMALPREGGPQPPPARRVTTEDVSVYSGRRTVLAELRRLAAQATTFFHLGGGGSLAARLADSPELLRDLRTAAERIGDFQILLAPGMEDPRSRRLLEAELGPGRIGVPPAGVPWPLTVAVNEATALFIASQPDDGSTDRGEDVALRAAAPPFVEHARQAFLREGPPMPVVAPVPAAPAPATILDLDARNVGLRFAQALVEARREVLGMGPEGWSRTLHDDWETLVGAYAGAKARGVTFRALCVDTPTEREALGPFRDIWDLKACPWIPAYVIVIDRRELFQAFPTDGTGALQARHSAEPNEVRYYVNLFDRLWQGAQVVPVRAAPATR